MVKMTQCQKLGINWDNAWSKYVKSLCFAKAPVFMNMLAIHRNLTSDRNQTCCWGSYQGCSIVYSNFAGVSLLRLSALSFEILLYRVQYKTPDGLISTAAIRSQTYGNKSAPVWAGDPFPALNFHWRVAVCVVPVTRRPAASCRQLMTQMLRPPWGMWRAAQLAHITVSQFVTRWCRGAVPRHEKYTKKFTRKKSRCIFFHQGIHETSLEAREDFTSFPPAPVVLTGVVSIICDVHDYVPFLLAPDLYPKEWPMGTDLEREKLPKIRASHTFFFPPHWLLWTFTIAGSIS